MNFIDITGQKFGLLMVIRRHGASHKPVRWLCLCKCGEEKVVASYDLRTGHTKSCGCLKAKLGKQRRHSLIGKVFERWTVIAESHDQARTYGQRAYWLCRCICGTEREIRGENLTSAQTKSCGCLRTDVSGQLTYKHGNCRRNKRTREYRIWHNIKSRCFNPKVPSYKDYGGRGIKMCARWKNDFEAFLADMGPCPPGMSIERKNNEHGHYEPSNCVWAPSSVQARNRRNNHVIEFDGERMVMSDFAVKLGISAKRVSRMLLSGKSPNTIAAIIQMERIPGTVVDYCQYASAAPTTTHAV